MVCASLALAEGEVTMLIYCLTRTTTEEFQYVPDELRERFGDEFDAWKVTEIASREHYGHTPWTPEELWDNFVIELFEAHDGSKFGDGLFGSTNEDYGIGLETRRDDE